jgi:hypothetical protein
MSSISFSPALPCSSMIGDTLCGKDATVATLYPMGGGQFILQPFCRTCVAQLQQIYGPPAEPSDDPRSGWLNMSNGEEVP